MRKIHFASNSIRRMACALLTGVLLLPSVIACQSTALTVDTTTAAASTTPGVTTKAPEAYPYPTTPQTPSAAGLSWEAGQIFPTFPEGSGELDVIVGSNLTVEEMNAYACLQGHVNAREIRMAVYVDSVEEWAKVYGYTANKATTRGERDAIVKKYASEITGVVIYTSRQAKTCPDIANLATSVANIKGAIPLTESIYQAWRKRGIDLPVVEDLTDLKLEDKIDVYNYLYNHYWKDCSKRLLFIQDPTFHQMRDLAAASGAAVIHLSCSSDDMQELRIVKKFFADLTPGESMLMGWNGQERELMTTAAQYGLSCVPADYFCSPSLFARDMDVKINAVPDMPELENKIYIAFYFSDGDNIQYNMNAMKEYWDNGSRYRGQIPINWTISPALLEVAPGMMNYYYQSATEKECFVSGPSGLGYTIPVNSFGANQGNNFKNDEYFSAFVQLTNRYLAATGLRAVTIWDNLSASQRQIYTSQGTYLYGLTVQNLVNGNLNLGYTGVTNDMLIQQLTPGYFAKNEEGTNPLTDMTGDIERAVRHLGYDGTAPVFISCQVSIWGFHNVPEVVSFEQHLSEKYAAIYGEDVVEFVRADHYFNLYNQANGMPYDLTLRFDVTVSASSATDSAALVADGTPETVWEASENGEEWLALDFGATYSLSEVSVFFAEMEGEKYTAADNAKAMKVEVSTDGKGWTQVATVADNTEAWVNLPFGAAEGRYLRITVTDPGESGIARIADVNVNGVAK
ncbi:MAG: discoidin domain-containing protein [Clostridia bacterium]|nr:discoidin domain-containing protein [Clostridia bacterium]